MHRWSEHPESDVFVDEIYQTYIHQKNNNKNILKKHLNVVLLDLYIAWLNDPKLNIAVHMTEAAYSDGQVFSKGKLKYNEPNIKVSIIKDIHRLRDTGLIGFQKGYEGGAEWVPQLLRIWPNAKLIKMFEDLILAMQTTERPSSYVMRTRLMHCIMTPIR